VGALRDEVALKFGKRSEDAEDQLARRRRRVDCRTLTGQDLQTDTPAKSATTSIS
jgi:hypothetical protein